MFEEKYNAVNNKIKASDELKARIRKNAKAQVASIVTVNSTEFKEVTPSQKNSRVNFIALFSGCAACAAIVAVAAIGFSMKNGGNGLVTPPADSGSSSVTTQTSAPQTGTTPTTGDTSEPWIGEANPELNHSVEYNGDTYNFSELVNVCYGAANMYPVQAERGLYEVNDFNLGKMQYRDGIMLDWSFMANYSSISENGNGYKRYSYSLEGFYVNIEFGDYNTCGDFGAYHFYDEEGLEEYAELPMEYRGKTAPTSMINGYEIKVGITSEGSYVMSFVDENKPMRVCISMMGSGEKAEQEFLFAVRSFCYDVLDGYTMTEQPYNRESAATVSIPDLKVELDKYDADYAPDCDYPDESMKGVDMINYVSGRDFTAFIEGVGAVPQDIQIYTGTTNEAEGIDRVNMWLPSNMSVLSLTVRNNAPDNDTAFPDDEHYSEYKGYSFEIGEYFTAQSNLILEYRHENGTLYRMTGINMTREAFLERVKLFFDTVFINTTELSTTDDYAIYVNFAEMTSDETLFKKNDYPIKANGIMSAYVAKTDIDAFFCARGLTERLESYCGEITEESVIHTAWVEDGFDSSKLDEARETGLIRDECFSVKCGASYEVYCFRKPNDVIRNAAMEQNSYTSTKNFYLGKYGDNKYFFRYTDKANDLIYEVVGKDCGQTDFLNLCLTVLGEPLFEDAPMLPTDTEIS